MHHIHNTPVRRCSRGYPEAVLAFGGGVRAQSVIFGKRLIGKGDQVSQVRDAAGTPGKVDRIDADYSTPVLAIWTCEREQREVSVWIVSGEVGAERRWQRPVKAEPELRRG